MINNKGTLTDYLEGEYCNQYQWFQVIERAKVGDNTKQILAETRIQRSRFNETLTKAITDEKKRKKIHEKMKWEATDKLISTLWSHENRYEKMRQERDVIEIE